MASTKVTKVCTRYVVQTGKFMATFEVDGNGKMTFYSAPNSRQIKEYHFEGSDPAVVKAIAKLLGQAANVAEKELKAK